MIEEKMEAAQRYVARGWRLFPMSAGKRPLTAHGRTDAAIDVDTIRAWLARWPDALLALATGAESGVVAVDVDIRETVDGRDSLDQLGVCLHPETPTAHSPSGGFHLLFRHPGGHVKSVAGKLGPGLDIRGDGGSICLPPGPGRYWDPALHIDTTAMADFPSWAVIKDQPIDIPTASPRPLDRSVSRYAEVALDSAVAIIIGAAQGQQATTLNKEAFSIGGLVAGGELSMHLAEAALGWAASRMPSYDRHRPWRARDVQRTVRDALVAGMRHPRMSANGR